MRLEMNSIRECIEQQLNEIELLRCCYPSADEFYLDDLEAFDQAKDFLNDKLESFQRNLRFIIKLHLTDIQVNIYPIKYSHLLTILLQTTIELQFIYPSLYPELPADIHLRTYFSRECHDKFNESVKKFSEEKVLNQQPYVMEFLSWIQDHQELFRGSSTTTKELQTKKLVYARLWIYSHHIYNIEKRRHIVHWANELRLNGFSLPGKPGIVCVEGEESDVDDYWTRLRNLTWKKLQIKEKETLIDDAQLRFNKFEELSILLDQHGKGDFGQLFQYLQEKQLEKMFYLYFGFDGTDKK